MNAVTAKGRACPDCDQTVRVKKDGSLYKHACHPPLPHDAADNGTLYIPESLVFTDPDTDMTGALMAATLDGLIPPGDGAMPRIVTGPEADEFLAPAVKPQKKGPWFSAAYDGECSGCDGAIFSGDQIRADGEGGYECADCGEHPWAQDEELRGEVKRSAPAPVHPYETITEPPLREVTVVELPTPDEFMSPSPVDRPDPGPMGDTSLLMPAPDEFMSPSPVGDAEPVMSVSGQPKKVLRDHLDRYCVVLPGETELELFKSSGNPVGRTRATTFNKAAQNSKSLNDWGKRNVVIGAARRRDLILQAHDLTHERDRDKLDRLVKELEEAAGAKVGSDLGTYLHDFTEYMDAGLKCPDDAPGEFQQSLWSYEAALKDAGLEPIRSLIERTTIISEYGWVCGTFDRIFYHRPSGRYVIGDLKTGKTMDYGKNEIECQLWTYAHGVNQNGIYDWNTRTWSRNDPSRGGLLHVSETVGVVIHMPVQGPLEGTVSLLWADLESGAAHAQVCADVRARAGGKMKPWGNGPVGDGRGVGDVLEGELVCDSDDVAPAESTWEDKFKAVRNAPEAGVLWNEARLAGVDPMRLQDLVAIARETLLSRVDTSA